MKVKLTVQANLADRPDGYLGQTGATYVIGAKEEANLEEAFKYLLLALADFYGMCYTADELNAQLDRAAEAFQELRFSDVKET